MPKLAVNQVHYTLTSADRAAWHAACERWDAGKTTARLWARDAGVWTGGDEARWLDWLDSPETERPHLEALRAFGAEVRSAKFTHVLLLGMGGSSLAPEVLRMTMGVVKGWPDLRVLDSTDPAQVRHVVDGVDLARTLVIVASKSGSTLEPNAFMQYVVARLREIDPDAPARQVIAITDPGSKLEKVARAEGFWRVFHGRPQIGGRFSALSPFGLVPATTMGLDAGRLLDEASAMREACRRGTALENPGIGLGVLLAVLVGRGRDKLTFLASPEVAGLGAWLEQLIAESTGKQGKAIIPVDLEPVVGADRYGDDRVFVHLHRTGVDDGHGALIEAVAERGHPVVRVEMPLALSLAQEFFRWEVATAAAGAVMGIHPFDQPDVEASKIKTRALTDEYESRGALPPETPTVREQGLTLFADAGNERALERAVSDRSLAGLVRAHLARLAPGDYLALLAYIEMTPAHRAVLQQMREAVLARTGVATCLGFGPRFLHSTGQAYKGGPASGVFLQITCDDRDDLSVPGQRYTFGVIKAAQARGDLDVLNERGRRALRVHLGADVAAGLEQLKAII